MDGWMDRWEGGNGRLREREHRKGGREGQTDGRTEKRMDGRTDK